MTSSRSGPPAVRPKGLLIGFGAGAIAVAAACGAGLFVARDQVAETLARNWLAERGVASSLEISALSGTHLSAAVRLGDPRRPTLTIDRLDVDYDLSGPWAGKPLGATVRRIRLVRPRLLARWTGAALDLGPLQPLVRELSKQPAGRAPAPDVAIEDGLVRLVAPGGEAAFRGDAGLRAGALSALGGELRWSAFPIAGGRLGVGRGTLNASRVANRLRLAVDLAPLRFAEAGTTVAAPGVSLAGELPYPDRGGRMVGPAHVALRALNVAADGDAARAQGAGVDLDLDGALDASAAGQSLLGRLRLTARADSLAAGGASLGAASAQLDLPRTALTVSAQGASLRADGAAAAGGRLMIHDGAASLQAGAVRVQELAIDVRSGRLAARATLDGVLAGEGGLSAAAARRFSGAVPVLSGEPAYAAGLERALRAFKVAARWRAELSDRGATVALPGPLTVTATSGARLTLAPSVGGVTVGPGGAAVAGMLTLAGGGLPQLTARVASAQVTAAGYSADLDATGALDALFAKGAELDLAGRLTGKGAQLRFALAGCRPQRAARLAFDPNPVTSFAGELCPGEGPLLEAGPGGWRAQGRIEAAQGHAPSFGADFAAASGAFQAEGAGGLGGAKLTLAGAAVADATDPARFRPIQLAGEAGYGANVWTGALTATTGAGHRIGSITLRHDIAAGAGRADIETGLLQFAAGGLQPAELSSMADVARQATGAADFTGWFAWTADGKSASGGALTTRGLQFKSPLGPVLDVDTKLRFTSLSPLVTAPNQSLTVRQVQSVTSLDTLAARFDFNADQIRIEIATGQVAHGRIRLEPTVEPLAPDAVRKGVLVLDNVDIGQLVGASSLADTVKLDAVVNGRIPFELGPQGLAIREGRLEAVRPGRLSIARKTLAGVAGQTGFAQDLAYQAMENLAFDRLDASLNTTPDDRLGILFHIRGRHAPPTLARATIAVGDILRGKALAKPLTLPSGTQIDLTLDMSLNFGELVRAMEQAWRDSLAEGPGSPRVQAGQAPVSPR